ASHLALGALALASHLALGAPRLVVALEFGEHRAAGRLGALPPFAAPELGHLAGFRAELGRAENGAGHRVGAFLCLAGGFHRLAHLTPKATLARHIRQQPVTEGSL